MLAFPEGRLASRNERRLIAGLWVTAFLANALPAVFNRHIYACDGCPHNPIVIANRPAARRCARGDVLGDRPADLPRRPRSARPPLAARDRRPAPDPRAGLPVRRDGRRARLRPVRGRLRRRRRRGRDRRGRLRHLRRGPALLPRRPTPHAALPCAAQRLLREVPDEPTPEQAQAGLRNVLGDPTLQFLTWLDETGCYVDARGAPAELHARHAAARHDPDRVGRAAARRARPRRRPPPPARPARRGRRGGEARAREGPGAPGAAPHGGTEPGAARGDPGPDLHDRPRRHLPRGAGRPRRARRTARRDDRPERPRPPAAGRRRALPRGARRACCPGVSRPRSTGSRSTGSSATSRRGWFPPATTRWS